MGETRAASVHVLRPAVTACARVTMAVYTVNIERDGGELGFSVKGGREHGIGILVSSVDPRGIART